MIPRDGIRSLARTVASWLPAGSFRSEVPSDDAADRDEPLPEPQTPRDDARGHDPGRRVRR